MSMSTNRFETFELDHRLKNARVHYLPEGELWFAEKDAGLWAISWYPCRSDHPDAPVLVTASKREGIATQSCLPSKWQKSPVTQACPCMTCREWRPGSLSTQ